MNIQKGNLYLIIAIIIGAVAISAVGFASWKYFGEISELEQLKEKETQPVYSPEKEKTIPEVKKQEEIIPSGKTDETAGWKSYENKEYGFEITLLNSWKGYSVLEETWNGVTLNGKDTKFKGPQIAIRHPKWTISQPWQDIPVMVFTNEEWKLVEARNLSVSAAPIGPRKLDQNQNYVFALPPRWVGFTDNLGQDEAKQIVKTFKAFNVKNEISDWKTYRNEKYEFEFKYPLDWQLTEDFSDSSIGGPISGFVPEQQFSPIKVQLRKKLEESYIRERYPEWPSDWGGSCTIRVITSAEVDENFNQEFREGCQEYKTKDIKVGKKEAIECNFPVGPAGWEAVWTSKDGKGIAFIFSHLSPEDCKAIFYQILSTFKFTE